MNHAVTTNAAVRELTAERFIDTARQRHVPADFGNVEVPVGFKRTRRSPDIVDQGLRLRRRSEQELLEVARRLEPSILSRAFPAVR